MEKIVDAREKSCPMPVIMTKKEIDGLDGGNLKVIVDNDVARENVAKLVGSLGYDYKIEEVNLEEFNILVDLGQASGLERVEKLDKRLEDLSLGFSKDIMGSGDEILGKILMNSYIYTVSEVEPYPKTMVFFNTGVNLTCKGSELIDDLIKLEEAGVEIISCGTCLDYFNMQDDLQVGSISNMYSIYEKLRKTKSNIVL